MSDWGLPTLSDPYVNFMDSLKARDLDAISLGGAGIVPVPIIGMMRYDRPANLFMEYVAGNIWQNKVLSVAGGGTGSNTPAGAVANLGLGTMALQNANNVSITGGVISGLSYLQNNGTTALSGRVDLYGGLWVNAGGLAVNGQGLFNNNLQVIGQIDCNFISAPAGMQILPSGYLTVGGTCNLNGQVNINAAHITGLGGLTVDHDIAVSGSIYANTASINTVLTAGGVTSTGNINVANFLQVDGSGQFNVNLTVVGSGYFTDLTINRNLAVVGTLYSGPGGMTVLTNNADGRIYASAIGAGYSGTGTKVLTDNGNWIAQNLIGGGVREVVHQNFSFGTDEAIKDVVVNWAGAQPAGPKNWNLVFDQPYQDQASGNGGTVFYNVTYLSGNIARITRTLGPGAVPPLGPTGVVYTAFHHRTEV